MSTWVGVGSVVGAGSLDGFAIGVMTTGAFFLANTAPRRARRRQIMAAGAPGPLGAGPGRWLRGRAVRARLPGRRASGRGFRGSASAGGLGADRFEPGAFEAGGFWVEPFENVTVEPDPAGAGTPGAGAFGADAERVAQPGEIGAHDQGGWSAAVGGEGTDTGGCRREYRLGGHVPGSASPETGFPGGLSPDAEQAAGEEDDPLLPDSLAWDRGPAVDPALPGDAGQAGGAPSPGGLSADGALPEVGSPDGALPEIGFPDGALPEGRFPVSVSPETGFPGVMCPDAEQAAGEEDDPLLPDSLAWDRGPADDVALPGGLSGDGGQAGGIRSPGGAFPDSTPRDGVPDLPFPGALPRHDGPGDLPVPDAARGRRSHRRQADAPFPDEPSPGDGWLDPLPDPALPGTSQGSGRLEDPFPDLEFPDDSFWPSKRPGPRRLPRHAAPAVGLGSKLSHRVAALFGVRPLASGARG